MTSYKNLALEKLKEAGYKITQPKRALIDLLEKGKGALSPYEMSDQLKKKGIRVNVVTLYRILEVFEQLSLVHKIFVINGYLRCHNSPGDSVRCHHYAVCMECKSVQEIEGEDLSALERKLKKNSGFKSQGHCLEFMGVCKRCTAKVQFRRSPASS